MKLSKTHIVATIGPTSEPFLEDMARAGMDMVRLNFSWGDDVEHERQIKLVRTVAKKTKKNLPIIVDLPGPRVQKKSSHSYHNDVESCITEEDVAFMRFGVKHKIEYFALSFVGTKDDLVRARELIKSFKGNQKLIAKIERRLAYENLSEILAVTDMVMVARGDLGNEFPLEEIPFVQQDIITQAKRENRPVITATQMLLSMVSQETPTRAEVTDVANAILLGSDAVMLSEETARGSYPREAVLMMERIVNESEKRIHEGFAIEELRAREILDSRGNPTLEVLCALRNGVRGIASVPSGASTGVHEAHELRDGGSKRFSALGVKHACAFVEGEILSTIRGKIFNQRTLDEALIELDGSSNKSRLGANAILGVSLAFARAITTAENKPLYMYIESCASETKTRGAFPQPAFNIINGGKHADSGLDIQEFMIVPVGFQTVAEKVRVASEITQTLKKIILARGLSVGVGDEGGFAPRLNDNEEALGLIGEAITQAGYTNESVKIALDIAASSFYQDGTYTLHTRGAVQKWSHDELISWYAYLVKNYPIISIEDGCAEDDWRGFSKLKQLLGGSVQIVGDDLTVTNVARIKEAHRQNAINAVLIKPNQIGTLTETIDAVKLTQSYGWAPFVSHRSGETNDTFVSDLAVGLGCPFIKAGAPVRGERVVKYNRLMEIEGELLGEK